MEQLEFNSFLLSLSKELEDSDFEQLKFLLKAFVPLGKSEVLTAPYKYFEELERMRKLSPTDFSILRKGFKEIGRQDLVEKLDGKKDYFNQLFQPKLKDHQKGKFDDVCDGNDRNSVQMGCLSRGDYGAPKAVKLMGNIKDDDLLLEEFEVSSEDGDKESKGTFSLHESAEGSHIDPLVAFKATLSEPRNDEEPRAALGTCGINSSEGSELAQSEQKEPCKSVTVGNGEKTAHKVPFTSASTYTSPVHALKEQNQALGDDVVPDGIEDEKAESKEPSGNKGEVSSEAQGHQSSKHDYGGARPKHQTTSKHPVSSESTLLGPHTKMDQGYGTILSSGTVSGKEPIEDECSTSSPSGDIVKDDISSVGAMATSKCKGETVNACSKKGAMTSDNSKNLDTWLSSQFSSGPDGTPNQEQMIKLLQQLLLSQQAIQGSSTQPATNPIMQPKSYDKGGYSVVISNGTLWDCSEEKGIVIMETGTQFHIAIANNNDFDAEVDITFGGMYLGVWLVEAKRSLQSPLIVEGSSYAEGRLKFFSASDTSAPKINEDYYGRNPELNDIIELEFKPEELIVHFFVRHLPDRNNSPKDIVMSNFKTATIGDLKREINKKFSSEVALLMFDGRILEEEKTMSSYALKGNDIIEVLFTEEKLLLIESTGRTQQTMLIEPRKTSIQDVKEFIATNIRIPVDKQRISYHGVNMCDTDAPSLLRIFTKAKAPPVFEVSSLIEDSEPPIKRTQRGFQANRSTGRRLRGFGDHTSCDSAESMMERFQSSPRASLFRGDHDHGNVSSFAEFREGRALLCGDEENVFKQFEEDKLERNFSKEHAVKLVIQLVSKRSSEPTGPKSTRYPPPVPE